MAEEEVSVEAKVIQAPLDNIAHVVQEKFQEAREYRRDHEVHWQEAYDAYRAKYPSNVNKSSELASERGIFVNQTRRKVNSAKIKIGTLLFEDGKVPFSITPSRNPRFFPPDVQAPPERPDMLEDKLTGRSIKMEERIRDILDITDYNTEIAHAIHEMALYGTGVTKGITLQHRNYPVYRSVRTPDEIMAVEQTLEAELLPAVSYVSCWNVFPSPEATSSDDADYIIQRSFLSKIQLRQLAEQQEGWIPGAIEEVIENNIGESDGHDDSEHPKKYDESSGNRVKKIEVLEFWGKLDGKDLEGHLPMDSEDMPMAMPVVVTVIGDKVIKIAENPFDQMLPYHFCYWQKNPESIWGDGIYYAIRDAQSILNFCYAMMIEGKSLSAAPLTVIDPNSFEPGTDTEQIYPGKQFRVKPGASVRDAFASIVIPDVTNGLLQIVQQLEKEADLDSGQTAIGYGDMSPAQTKTATGMSILNSNANRQTADVVRSVSRMITQNINAIYRWLMVDSPDASIKGDYEAISTGYEQYIAKEVHNTQLINFLQVVGGLPQLQQYLKYEAFSRPLLRAFNLEPEDILKTEQEVTMEMQQANQAQQQQIQQNQQMLAQQEQLKTQLEAQLESQKALLKEKQDVSSDQRELEMKERLELVKNGNVLHPTNLAQHSILLRETGEQERMQGAQLAEQRMMAQLTDADMEDPESRQPEIAGLRQDLEQIDRDAQRRLEGGPSAEEILQEEQAANAPA